MMFDLIIRSSIVCLLGVMIILSCTTGYALVAVGVNSPEVPDILWKYYKVSTLAAVFSVIPSLFLFDSVIRRRKLRSESKPKL
jgi:hypothetical protein